MAQLVVRNIPDESIAILKDQAKGVGLSTEAFVRNLIQREAARAAQLEQRHAAMQKLGQLRALSPPSQLSSTDILRDVRESSDAGG